MQNHYQSYYVNQVGSGLQGFQGVRYQKGHGFFGRILSGVLPFFRELFPILGKKALTSGVGLAQDILEGQNFKQAASKRLKTAGRDMATETLDKLKSKVQTGSGLRKKRFSLVSKKRKRSATKTKKKSVKFNMKRKTKKSRRVIKKIKGYKKRKNKNWWDL